MTKKESNQTMTTLTRSALLGAIKSSHRKVEIDGIGTVTIRSWAPVTRSRRQAAIASMTKEKQFYLATAYAVVDMVCDENGDPMFTDDDIKILTGDDVSSAKLDLLHDACQKFDEEESGNE